MVLNLQIELRTKTDNLFFFMGEIHRLCDGKKSFILGFKNGTRLYLETCKGLQRKAYICVNNPKLVRSTVTVLNYAVSLQANLQLTLEKSSLLVFEISSTSPETMAKIKSFADTLKVEY